MPESIGEWLWWSFSVLIVGSVTGIVVNLITPKVKETGEIWFQTRRLKKEEYKGKLERMATSIRQDPSFYLVHYSPYIFTQVLMFFCGLFLLVSAAATASVEVLIEPYNESISRSAVGGFSTTWSPSSVFLVYVGSISIGLFSIILSLYLSIRLMFELYDLAKVYRTMLVVRAIEAGEFDPE